MARLADSAARGEAFTARAAQIVADAMPGPAQVPALSQDRDQRLADLSRHLDQSTNKER